MLDRMAPHTQAGPRDRMLAGLAVPPQWLEIDGVRSSLIDIGDGPPLVLLHGGVECGGALWAPVVNRLAAGHRVLVPDLPGLGESAAVDRLDVDRFRGWFAALLRATAVTNPTVVAHSLTGSLVTRAAARWSRMARQLVIYAAPAIGEYHMPWRLRYVAVRFAVRPTAGNAERFQRFALLDREATRRRDAGWFDAFTAYNRSRAQVPHVKRTMTRLVKAETTPVPAADLARIDVPVSLVWGRQDRMVPLGLAEAASARHGWPLYIVESAAHVPHIEQPEPFVEVLTAIESGISRRRGEDLA